MNNELLKKTVKLAAELIAVESVESNKSGLYEVLKIVSANLKEFTIENFESNSKPSILIYRGKSRPKKFKVILNAHLDVVPGKHEQFHPYIKSNKLYGRGAYDMKTAAAVFIVLFQEVVKQLEYPVGLQLVTDEEIGGYNGTSYQLSKGVDADFVIAGEYANKFVIKNAAKGVLRYKISARGKSAHAAYPWLGENALLEINNFITKLNKYWPNSSLPAWKSTINYAFTNVPNKTLNQVPDFAELYLDIRYLKSEKKLLEKQIHLLLHKKLKAEKLLDDPPFECAESNEYLKSLQQSCHFFSHKYGLFEKTHGTSDVRFFAQKKRVGVEFGLSGKNQHTENEYVNLNDIPIYFNILSNFLLKNNHAKK